MKPPTERFRSLDGLRGVACLGVAIHHCSGCIFVAGSSLADAPHVFFYGFSGVEVFFALSGFLLTIPFLRRRDEKADWAAFAWRRAKRIVPPAWGAMAVFTAIGLLVQKFSIEPFASAHAINLPNSAGQAFAMFLFWGRYYLNSSYWTMAVEVRWYLVLPLLVYAQKRFGTLRMLAGTLVVAVVFYLLRPHLGPVAYVAFGPVPLYLPLFGLGIATANMVATEARAVQREIPVWGIRAALALSALLVVVFTNSNLVTASRVVPTSLFGFLLLFSAIKDPVIRKVLSWRPLVWIGGISFSIYLTHEFVINLFLAAAQRLDLSLWEQCLAYFGLVPLMIVPVAFGFHLALERPFMRKKPATRVVGVSAEPGG